MDFNSKVFSFFFLFCHVDAEKVINGSPHIYVPELTYFMKKTKTKGAFFFF